MRTAVIDWLKIGAVAANCRRRPAAAASAAAPSGEGTEAAVASPYGAYLAGRHAQENGSYGAAALWYEQALRTDPQSPELISRTFLMEADDGHFNRAVPLAKQALQLDGSDAVANLVLLIDRAKVGDNAGALARARRCPMTGCTAMSARWRAPDPDGHGQFGGGRGGTAADLDKFDGFAPLEYFQLGMIYDFAGNSAKAEEYYKKTLMRPVSSTGALADTMANFYLRHGHPDEAKAIDDRFVKENAGSELAELVQASTVKESRRRLIGSAMDGLAEVLSTSRASSIGRKRLTSPWSTTAARSKLRPTTWSPNCSRRHPERPGKYQQSLAIYHCDPGKFALFLVGAAARRRRPRSARPHRRSRSTTRGDGGKEPNWACAEIQLADLLRGQKRFSEAADAYSEAIKRLKAEGMPPRWALYYGRGHRL